jgi:hypothetical protein
VIALLENNPQSLQSNSAAVSRRFSDGNVPLTGALGQAAYLKARFYADRHKANQRGLSLLMRHGLFAEAALIITAAKIDHIQG